MDPASSSQSVEQVFEQNPEAGAALVIGILAFALLLVVVGVLIAVLMAFLIYKPATRVPAAYQAIAPGMAFLMLVPLVNIVMPIILGTKLPESFRAYFDSPEGAAADDGAVGDAGKKLGTIWGVSALCCLVPIVNFFAIFVALVTMIMFVFKLWGMAKKIDQAREAEPVASAAALA